MPTHPSPETHTPDPKHFLTRHQNTLICGPKSCFWNKSYISSLTLKSMLAIEVEPTDNGLIWPIFNLGAGTLRNPDGLTAPLHCTENLSNDPKSPSQ